LIAFRDGRRKYPPMNYLFLPDPYLKAMADYFASEEPPFSPPTTPTVSSAILARGESILVWFSESVSAKLHSRTSRTVPKLYLPRESPPSRPPSIPLVFPTRLTF
jgi:hypothetical protein